MRFSSAPVMFVHREKTHRNEQLVHRVTLMTNRSRKAEKSTKRVRFNESSFHTKMVRVHFDPQLMDLVMSHDRLLSSWNTELFRIVITQNQKARFVSHSESLYHSFYVAKLNSTISKILNFMRIVEGGRLQKLRLYEYQRIYRCPWVLLQSRHQVTMSITF